MNNDDRKLDHNESSTSQETEYLLKDPANAAHLRKSIAEANSEKISPHELSDE